MSHADLAGDLSLLSGYRFNFRSGSGCGPVRAPGPLAPHFADRVSLQAIREPGFAGGFLSCDVGDPDRWVDGDGAAVPLCEEG